MKPSGSNSLSSSAHPSPTTSDGIDDTLMMGFELFDEQGKLNPRKVLFSAQTSPSRAASLLTTLFGGVMKWNARRWAKKHVTSLIKTQASKNANTRAALGRMLDQIKQKGQVNRREFFQLSAAAMLQEVFDGKPGENKPATEAKTVSSTGAHIINREELISSTLLELIETAADDAKPQELFKGVQLEKISKWVAQHVRSEKSPILLKRLDALKKNDLPAHEFIAKTWSENSTIPMAGILFRFHKEACESGFIDYCRGTPISELGEKFDLLEKFILNSDVDFSSIQKNYSHHQYAPMIEAKNRLNKILPLAKIFREEKKSLKDFDRHFKDEIFPDNDQADNIKAEPRPDRPDRSEEAPEHMIQARASRHARPGSRKTHAVALRDEPAHEVLEKSLSAAPERMRNHILFDFPRRAAESGFIDYCKGKPLTQLADKIDDLEKFVVFSDEDFDSLENILTPERYQECRNTIDRLYAEIQEYKKSQERSHTRIQSAEKSSKPSHGTTEAIPEDDIIHSARQQLVEVNQWLNSLQGDKPQSSDH